jgi:phosphatidate cytidylyltransferase
MAWTLALVLRSHFSSAHYLSLALTVGIVVTLMVLLFVRREGAFAAWAWMAGGALYIGWLLGLLAALRLEAGREWAFLAVFVAVGSDTFAYFIGKSFGRNRLAPVISPNKTWEGAMGGLIGAVIVALLFTLETPLRLPLGYLEAALLGVAAGIFGQLGDLVESLLKRNFSAKDSGTLMPGHGGLLDRIDSILFSGAAVYIYYILIFS